ncbi:hypothetical protein GCM10027425_08360 [Alteromonas gracilis]
MRPLFVTAIAGSVLALSACGGGAEPPEAAPPSSSGTPSGSASPGGSGTPEGEVTLPAEVRGTSAEAGARTVELFITEMNRAAISGDTRLLRQLYDADECENCVALTELIEDVYAGGGTIDGRVWINPQLGRPNAGEEGQLGVLVRLQSGGQIIKRSDGSVERGSRGQNLEQAYTLALSDQQWVVYTVNTRTMS